MNHRTLRRINAVLCLAVATCSLKCGAADAQYRWKNEQGEAVYSDTPPPAGVDFQRIDTSPGLNYVEPDQPAPDESEENADGSSADDTAGSPDDEDSQQKAALCEKARMNLLALNHRSSLTVHNEKGEARALSPEDMEFARENARQQIERYCD